ncbi:MAG TPA: hypothetical protein VIY73_23320 [Polyangiaceae bacterium]
MQKDYWPFVLLVFATVLSVTVFRTPAERAGDESVAAGSSGEPAGEHPPIHPSSSASRPPPNPNDAPLSEREQKDVHVRLTPDACNPIVRKANELSGVDENDKRKLLGTITCLRRGNVAWAKCVERASTKDDLATCSRRLLIE